MVEGALTGVGDGMGRDACLLQLMVAEKGEGEKEAGRIGGWGPRSTLCLLWEDKPSVVASIATIPRCPPKGERYKLLYIKTCLGELGEDFWTYGIALHADVGADKGMEVGGLGAKGFVHGAYADRDGSLDTPSPTGMDGTGCMMGGIVEEDGYTIGGADSNTHTGEVGEDDVDAFESCSLGCLGLTEIVVANLVGLNSMDLMGKDDVGGVAETQGVGQKLTIAKDGLGVIA